MLLHLRIPQNESEVTLVLNDRWFNPTDTVARHEAMYRLPLSRKVLDIKDRKWHRLQIFWHKNKTARVFVDGKQKAELPVVCPTEHGVSYLHLLGEHRPGEKILIDFVEGGQILR